MKRILLAFFVHKSTPHETEVDNMNKDKMKKWIAACAVRTVRTMAETAVGMIGTSVLVQDVHWQYVLSASVLSGIVTVLACIVSMPEMKQI